QAPPRTPPRRAALEVPVEVSLYALVGTQLTQNITEGRPPTLPRRPVKRPTGTSCARLAGSRRPRSTTPGYLNWQRDSLSMREMPVRIRPRGPGQTEARHLAGLRAPQKTH